MEKENEDNAGPRQHTKDSSRPQSPSKSSWSTGERKRRMDGRSPGLTLFHPANCKRRTRKYFFLSLHPHFGNMTEGHLLLPSTRDHHHDTKTMCCLCFLCVDCRPARTTGNHTWVSADGWMVSLPTGSLLILSLSLTVSFLLPLPLCLLRVLHIYHSRRIRRPCSAPARSCIHSSISSFVFYLDTHSFIPPP